LGAAVPLVVLAAGLACAFGPTIFSGFRRLQTDPGDTRFNHYVLEHSFRWVRGDELHRELWNPPFFAPQKNVLAYSDTLLAVAPAYWALRGGGLAPEPALAAWMMLMAGATFAAGYGLLRHGLRYGAAASSCGAFLMAFSSGRVNQLGHQQLLPHFFTIVAVHALLVLFTHETVGTRARRLWWAAFFGCFAAQFYAGYYYGFFLFLCLLLAAVGSLFVRSLRQAAWATVRRDVGFVAGAGGASALALIPLAWHYLQVAREVGVRGPEIAGLPRLVSFAYMGAANRLYGWTAGWKGFTDLPLAAEQAVGLGLVTSAVTLWFLWSRRRTPWVRVVTFVILAAFAFTTVFAAKVYLFRVWYYAVPGIQAIRVMARFWILLAIPAGIAVAAATEAIRRRAGMPVAVVLALLCCAEQLTATASYDVEMYRARIAAITEKLDPSESGPFFVAAAPGEEPYLSQLDAMWAGLEAGRPTVNGYSGNFPPGYELYESNAPDWQERLAAWEQARLPAEKVAVIDGEGGVRQVGAVPAGSARE
jgi:hypothetical protein